MKKTVLAESGMGSLCQDIAVVGFRPHLHVAGAVEQLLGLNYIIADIVEELHREGDTSIDPTTSRYLHAKAYQLNLVHKELQGVSETIESLPCSSNIA